MPSDDLGDSSELHALVGNRVQRRSRRGGRQCQKKQACGVKPVHRRPAVGPVVDVGGHALAAGDADQGRHEAVISVAVNRRSESHVRRANSPSGERR